MKYFLILLLLVFSLSFFSCNKEQSLHVTKTEIILNSLIAENNIKTCHVLTERHKALSVEYENVEFRIEHGFLKIATKVNGKSSDHSYCLEFLTRHKVNEQNILVLHFSLDKPSEAVSDSDSDSALE
jgi:hypothetical protein